MLYKHVQGPKRSASQEVSQQLTPGQLSDGSGLPDPAPTINFIKRNVFKSTEDVKLGAGSTGEG